LTAAAVTEAPAPRIGSIRLIGATLLLALAAAIALSPPSTASLGEAWFDLHQRVAPRVPAALPAVIVEVDAKSLATLGRWPWPRSLLAALLEKIAASDPAAIGLDILMPEPDPATVERSPDAEANEPLLTNDAVLAKALRKTPTVLAVAGLPEPSGMSLRATPFVLRGTDTAGPGSIPSALGIERFRGALTSVDELNRVASGWGLASAEPAKGVIRRLPLVALVGDGTLVPALELEMFRVAMRKPWLELIVSRGAIQGIAIGGLFVPTETDGGARIYFSKHAPDRFVSAVDVLEGRAGVETLRRSLVLVAVTGLGLVDYHYTPVGERMSGSEIHAQLLENLHEGTLLDRPPWGPALEAAACVLLGALLVWVTPLGRPGKATLVNIACVALLVAASYAAFRMHRQLLDAATPALALQLLFATLLALTLAEAARHRRALESVLHRQREEAARMAGELDAARRIQTASLPRAEPLCDERLDLAAAMQPAREVGGDLYDFFRLDEHRVFVLVGDVAGKGLSASIFMAVSKALYKSAALRSTPADVGALMAAANEEISRDNPEMLFVTAFAAVLDLESGTLAYCNAGHVNPWLTTLKDANVNRIGDGDGPPLCVVDGFAYRGAELALRGGDVVVVVSDGVTESHDASGAFYGEARVDALLARTRLTVEPIRKTVDALFADVARFAGDAEPADDITVLALRWNGASRR
jgi:serine phosphatase RsbU (regulator of sigma subunit)/CHASE2 domain-containing sensor protein